MISVLYVTKFSRVYICFRIYAVSKYEIKRTHIAHVLDMYLTFFYILHGLRSQVTSTEGLSLEL